VQLVVGVDIFPAQAKYFTSGLFAVF